MITTNTVTVRLRGKKRGDGSRSNSVTSMKFQTGSNDGTLYDIDIPQSMVEVMSSYLEVFA
jgi:hypothetical protein